MRVGHDRRESSTSSRRSTPGFSRRCAASSTPRGDLANGRHSPGAASAPASASAFSDRADRARSTVSDEDEVRAARLAAAFAPVYARVDTCAAEFVAHTPYLYSTYEIRERSRDADGRRRRSSSSAAVPTASARASSSTTAACTRCRRCASSGSRPSWSTAIPRRCRPTTTRPIACTSSRSRSRTCSRSATKRSPSGVIVQFGGQTPLKLAVPLEKRGIKLLGTTRRRDRSRRGSRPLRRAAHASSRSSVRAAASRTRVDEALHDRRGDRLPGARAPELRARRPRDDDRVLDATSSTRTCSRAFEAAREAGTQTILVDEFLKDAIEVDVDCVVRRQARGHRRRDAAHRGGRRALRRLVERAAAALAARRRSCSSIEEQTRMLALELGVVGLMNVQFAVKGGEVYILEVNPRASRTVPFVSKATGRPLAKIAAQAHGRQDARRAAASTTRRAPRHVSVKESVFPFAKFPGVDTILGPGDALDRRGHGHRGDVRARLRQGDARERHRARVAARRRQRAQAARVHQREGRGQARGACLIAPAHARARVRRCVATGGTAAALARARIPVEVDQQGERGLAARASTRITSGTIAIVVNTTIGAKEVRDSYSLRRQTLLANIPYFTTIAAGARGVRRARGARRASRPPV